MIFLENRCPTLKEFSLIRRDSFISSLVQKVRHEYDDNLPAQIAIGIKIGDFRTISFRYINECMGIERLEEELTIGEIMSCALNNCTKYWTPYITPYEDFQDRGIDSYELLVSLLMDSEPDPEHEDKDCRNLDKFKDDEEGLRSKLSKAKASTHRNTLKILKAMEEIKFIDGYNLIRGNDKEIIGVEIIGKANMKKYFGNMKNTKNMQEKTAN